MTPEFDSIIKHIGNDWIVGKVQEAPNYNPLVIKPIGNNALANTVQELTETLKRLPSDDNKITFVKVVDGELERTKCGNCPFANYVVDEVREKVRQQQYLRPSAGLIAVANCLRKIENNSEGNGCPGRQAYSAFQSAQRRPARVNYHVHKETIVVEREKPKRIWSFGGVPINPFRDVYYTYGKD